MENLYKPPESNVTLEDKKKTSDYKLFKVSGIGVATFFGTVLAGGYLMYRNYKSLGKHAEAKQALIWSAVAVAAIVGIALILPENINSPSIGFTVVQVVVITQLAKKFFADALLDHELQGGVLASNWLAFGIALLVLLVLFVILVAFVIAGTFVGVWE